MDPIYSSAYGQSSYVNSPGDGTYDPSNSSWVEDSSDEWPFGQSSKSPNGRPQTHSLHSTFGQMNAAIQTPDSSLVDIGLGDSTAGNAGSADGNTNGSTTNGANDNTQNTDQQQKADEAKQKSDGMKIQQDNQTESDKQTSEGQQANSQGKNSEQINMAAGGANNESPGQQLNKEIQDTRQAMQGEPEGDDSGDGGQGGGGIGMKDIALGGAAVAGGAYAVKKMSGGGNKENVFTQTSQKAHMADQQHKQGKKMNMMGLMQAAKGRAMVAAGMIMIKVGEGLTAAGTAIMSTGEALESNPFTAAIGAALVAVGTALRAAGTALKAAGNATKASGEALTKAGGVMEKDGEKLTKKADQGAKAGHTMLEHLRNHKKSASFTAGSMAEPLLNKGGGSGDQQEAGSAA